MRKKSTLLLVILTISLSSFAQESGTLSVSGTATKKIQADELIIKTGINLEGEDAAEIFKASSKAMDLAIKYLKVKSKSCSYETDIVRLHSTKDYKTGRITYRSNQLITITLHDFSEYDIILQSLIAMGFNTIQSVSFGLSDPAKYKKEVHLLAIDAGKKKAEETARQLGVELGNVRSFSEQPIRSVYPAHKYENAVYTNGEVSDGSSTLAPGQINMTVTVHLVYEIKK